MITVKFNETRETGKSNQPHIIIWSVHESDDENLTVSEFKDSIDLHNVDGYEIIEEYQHVIIMKLKNTFNGMFPAYCALFDQHTTEMDDYNGYVCIYDVISPTCNVLKDVHPIIYRDNEYVAYMLPNSYVKYARISESGIPTIPPAIKISDYGSVQNISIDKKVDFITGAEMKQRIDEMKKSDEFMKNLKRLYDKSIEINGKMMETLKRKEEGLKFIAEIYNLQI